MPENDERTAPLPLPEAKDVRWWWVKGRAKGTPKAPSEDQFDRWLEERDRENRAIGWDEALAHAWKLNDPAYTVITDTESIHPIVTEADIYQAKRENPYRGDNR